jgi:hypothetical protein
VPVIGTQQFVEQSAAVLQLGRQANAPVESNVVHCRPPQQRAVPPHFSSMAAQRQRLAAPQNPGLPAAKEMQQPVSQSEAVWHGLRQPA